MSKTPEAVYREELSRRINLLTSDSHTPKAPEVWRIKLDGGFISLHNGKCKWNRIGHAKSALRNSVFPDLSWWGLPKTINLDYKQKRELTESIYQEFLKERVEFVRVW